MALGPRPRFKPEVRTSSASVEGDGRSVLDGAPAAADSVVSAPGDGAAPQRRADDFNLVEDFNELIARYKNPLFNLIYQWIGNYDEAEDLTQDTFVAAYRAKDQFRGESRVYTWLYRIAHNQCKNRFKQRDRARRVEGESLDAGWGADDSDAPPPMEVADWSYSPEKLLARKELQAAVNRAIDSLAFEYRSVLILRDMEELSYAEIADVTGLTMENVKTRLNRARNMVRQKVEPYFKM
jgi:RNA polymerase sigma-70 factor (ECF subfamily)